MRLCKWKIQRIMQEKGIVSFKQLAEKLDVTPNQLSVMMSESYSPIKRGTIKLCQALDVSLEEICVPEKKESRKNVNISKDDITGIELFAGAGGLALGLEEAGIKGLLFNEIDTTCCDTLRTNRPDWNVQCQDIHTMDFSEYKGKVDLVSGGFPCQAFSQAGKRLGFEDTRGTLFYEFARCIKEVQPKMFLAENVKGLVSHDNGRTLATILDVFRELGYDVQTQVLNASYYGVGQKRERLIIIGCRMGFGIKFEYPIADTTQTTLQTALKDCPPSKGAQYSEKKKKVFELVPPGGCWVNLPESVAKEYMGKSFYSGGGRRGMARRISWNEPCLTLTCSPSQKQTDRCHPDEARPFTVREYARIQSFPDEWEFCGGLGAQYKQIGNAVPVEMARRIGVEIVKSIKKQKAFN